MLSSIRIRNQRPVPLYHYSAFLQVIPGHTRAKEFPFVFQLVISFSVFFISVYPFIYYYCFTFLNETLLQMIFYFTMETKYQFVDIDTFKKKEYIVLGIPCGER